MNWGEASGIFLMGVGTGGLLWSIVFAVAARVQRRRLSEFLGEFDWSPYEGPNWSDDELRHMRAKGEPPILRMFNRIDRKPGDAWHE